MRAGSGPRAGQGDFTTGQAGLKKIVRTGPERTVALVQKMMMIFLYTQFEKMIKTERVWAPDRANLIFERVGPGRPFLHRAAGRLGGPFDHPRPGLDLRKMETLTTRPSDLQYRKTGLSNNYQVLKLARSGPGNFNMARPGPARRF